jgi:hypothetical protein
LRSGIVVFELCSGTPKVRSSGVTDFACRRVAYLNDLERQRILCQVISAWNTPLSILLTLNESRLFVVSSGTLSRTLATLVLSL